MEIMLRCFSASNGDNAAMFLGNGENAPMFLAMERMPRCFWQWRECPDDFGNGDNAAKFYILQLLELPSGLIVADFLVVKNVMK